MQSRSRGCEIRLSLLLVVVCRPFGVRPSHQAVFGAARELTRPRPPNKSRLYGLPPRNGLHQYSSTGSIVVYCPRTSEAHERRFKSSSTAFRFFPRSTGNVTAAVNGTLYSGFREMHSARRGVKDLTFNGLELVTGDAFGSQRPLLYSL